MNPMRTLVVGHVTLDRFGNDELPGGGAYYAGQTARALGATVGGTLYLSLAGWLSTVSAAVLLLALLTCFSLTVLVISLKLPDPS